MKLLDREPTLWLGTISSLIVLIGTFGLDILNGQQAALLVAAINGIFGAINAYAVRPISPVAFTYAIGALVALAGAYGLNLTIEQIAGINAVVVPVLALLSRGQVTPADTAITRESTGVEVAREVGAPGPSAPVA